MQGKPELHRQSFRGCSGVPGEYFGIRYGGSLKSNDVIMI